MSLVSGTHMTMVVQYFMIAKVRINKVYGKVKDATMSFIYFMKPLLADSQEYLFHASHLKKLSITKIPYSFKTVLSICKDSCANAPVLNF
jgi:hypothetical protein